MTPKLSYPGNFSTNAATSGPGETGDRIYHLLSMAIVCDGFVDSGSYSGIQATTSNVELACEQRRVSFGAIVPLVSYAKRRADAKEDTVGASKVNFFVFAFVITLWEQSV